MKNTIILAVVASVILGIYYKYSKHMNEFNKDREILKQEKIIYIEDQKQNKLIERNNSIILNNVKEMNEELSKKQQTTDVNFSNGEHSLSI